MDIEVYSFPPPPPAPQRRWNMRALNELYKLGGKIAAVIDQYRRSTPNRKRLELKAKPDADTGASPEDVLRRETEAIKKESARITVQEAAMDAAREEAGA